MSDCTRKDCESGEPGTWLPVLFIYPPKWGPAGPNMMGKVKGDPAKMALSLPTCPECRPKAKMEDFLDDSNWPLLCAQFVGAGKMAPVREKTQLRWLEIPEDWDDDVSDLRDRVMRMKD